MVNIIVLIVAALMGLAGSVNAAGFRLADQDAKATGMANAFTAVADNASAVWYNPAAITDLEGNNVALGTVLVMPTMEHKNTNGTTDKIKNRTHIPPHFYATFKKSEKLSFGIGVNAPFGLSTEWDPTTANTRTVATKSEVKAINYNVSAAVKASEKVSFAVGADYVQLDATLNKMIIAPANALYPTSPAVNEEQTLKGDGNGMGYNAAVMYKHNDKWSFGANYHSPVKINVDGKINLLANSAVAPAAKATDRDATTKLTLPDTLQLGVSYKYSDKLVFAADVDYTDWATYHRIVIDYTRNTGTAAQSIDTKNWKSVWAFRLGTEYKYSDTLKFRAGTFYDMNPVKEKYFETRVPDTDRLAFSVGAGWKHKDLTVDVTYMYLMFMERTIDSATASTTLYGKYNSKAHLPGLTVGYKF